MTNEPRARILLAALAKLDSRWSSRHGQQNGSNCSSRSRRAYIGLRWLDDQRHLFPRAHGFSIDVLVELVKAGSSRR